MINNHQQNILAYDKKAAHYDDTYDGKFTENFKTLLVEIVKLQDDDSVLDVACGSGKLLAMLQDKAKIKGFGTDISPQMVKHAAKRYPQFHFQAASCEALPVANTSMDIITVCSAYHHFPDVRAFAREAGRVLKLGGSLFIAEVSLPGGLRHLANLLLPLSKEGDVKFYSAKEIVQDFAPFGFALQHVHKQKHIQIVHLKLCSPHCSGTHCYNFNAKGDCNMNERTCTNPLCKCENCTCDPCLCNGETHCECPCCGE